MTRSTSPRRSGRTRPATLKNTTAWVRLPTTTGSRRSTRATPGEHGNWWNAVVWAECRERAGDYFQGIAASEFPGPIDRQQARHLAVDYRALSRLLYRASDRTASAEQKHQFVSKARDLEGGCVERIAELRAH